MTGVGATVADLDPPGAEGASTGRRPGRWRGHRRPGAGPTPVLHTAGRVAWRAGGPALAVTYLSLLVLLPLAALCANAFSGGWAAFWGAVTEPQAVAALELTLGVAAAVALFNSVAGFAIAWVLVRDDFRGKALVGAVIDLPFALPTIVAGLTLLALYGPDSPFHVNLAGTRLGIGAALLFVTLPFCVRSVQPVLAELDAETEEAASSLGAGRRQVLRRVILPSVLPSVLAGAGLAFAPRRRRVRLGRADLGQHPLQDRGRLLLHLQPLPERRPPGGQRRLRRARRHLAPRARGDRVGPAPLRGPRHRMTRSRWRLPLRIAVLGYLALLVLLPVGTVFFRAFQHGLGAAWDAITAPDALHALVLTLLVAAIAVPLNTIFGVGVSLILARHRFPGAWLLDALVDIPLAISPVVIGLALILVYGRGGWLGPWLGDHHVTVIFALPGIVMASAAVSLPYVVREVLPVLQEIGTEQEQAARTLGAGPLTVFRRITLPNIRRGLAYGVTLTTARVLGEFGAVAIVSGAIAGRTQTLTLFISASIDDLDTTSAYVGAVALCLSALIILILLTVSDRNREAWHGRRAA